MNDLKQTGTDLDLHVRLYRCPTSSRRRVSLTVKSALIYLKSGNRH